MNNYDISLPIMVPHKTKAVSSEGLPAKDITYATHGLNELRVCGVFFQFLTQPADMHINGACITRVIVAPDIMQQLVTSQHSPTITYKVGKQIELLWLQFQLLPPAMN